MHELSIACSIVETVEEVLPDENSTVKTVFLKIGAMSGVVRDALLFSFEVAAQDTRAAGAVLEIEEIPVVVHCDPCGKDTELGNPPIFRCAFCGQSTAKILQGKEMEIVSIEIEDGKAANS
ncbi:MAG: hydrogenase maturation nickel metallochaperone HypA [Acidobacteria bacterium]|nr:hydrogenase maturation nickel metallochaperone HypA [Acidobacteriota bacterium]